MKRKMKLINESSNAITLISLVITIVVLIILAGVAIYLSLGNNGIFTRANEAKEVTNKQQATDIINLKITTVQMNKYAEKQEMPTLQELADVLYEDSEIQYVALESKVADKEKVIVGNKTSIFTKLNKYPYEFEINGQLQLASIDGIKIANSNNSSKKEVLWRTDETGIQTVNLEKNISDYDYIIVFYEGYQSNGEAIFDTTESYNKQFNYTYLSSYVIGTINIDKENNIIKMVIDTNDDWGSSSINYIKKIIGIKL